MPATRRRAKPKSIREQADFYRLRSGLWLEQAPRGYMDQALEEVAQATMGRVPPPSMLTPETLRYMAERSKTFAAIMYRRSQQVAQFARRPLFDGDTGFEVVPRIAQHAMEESERIAAKKIETMLLATGTVYNPRREDNLRTALQKMLYSTLVYDAIVIEPVYNTLTGELIEWFVLDGGTIQRVDPDKYDPITEAGRASAPIHFVQIKNNQVVAEWNADQLIYIVRNPSTDPARFGYGQPELELMVDVITIEIEVLTWGKMVLANSSVPDGLVLLESNAVDTPTVTPFGSRQNIEDFRREWRQKVAGARNAGSLAIFQTPHGSKAQFYEAATKNRDMPFRELYELCQNVICAYMGISPAELSILEGSLKESSFIDSDAKSSQMRYSRMNGLLYLLNILAEALNAIIARINPDYTVLWRGVDHTAEELRHNLEAAMLESGRLTLDDVRRMSNQQPYGKWWSKIPINPTILQIEAAERGVPLKGGFGGGAGAPMPEGGKKAKPGVAGQPGSRVSGKPATPKKPAAKRNPAVQKRTPADD